MTDTPGITRWREAQPGWPKVSALEALTNAEIITILNEARAVPAISPDLGDDAWVSTAEVAQARYGGASKALCERVGRLRARGDLAGTKCGNVWMYRCGAVRRLVQRIEGQL